MTEIRYDDLAPRVPIIEGRHDWDEGDSASDIQETGNDLDDLLKARGREYGDFRGHAAITQGLKDIMHGTQGWDLLEPWHKEALDMIAHKIGRILNGNPNNIDSWDDTAGYARLPAKILRGEPL